MTRDDLDPRTDEELYDAQCAADELERQAHGDDIDTGGERLDEETDEALDARTRRITANLIAELRQLEDPPLDPDYDDELRKRNNLRRGLSSTGEYR